MWGSAVDLICISLVFAIDFWIMRYYEVEYCSVWNCILMNICMHFEPFSFQVFHLRDIRWEKPQFLSKSFLGFVTFNIITYSLLLAEFMTTQFANTTLEEKVNWLVTFAIYCITDVLWIWHLLIKLHMTCWLCTIEISCTDYTY